MAATFMRLGFHFGEDLQQLRRKLPFTLGFYEPNNLLCISKLVSQVAAFF